LQLVTPTDTRVDNFVQPLAVSLSNGTNSGQADQIFSGQFSAPASSTTVYDETIQGTNDALGNPLYLRNAKVFYVGNVDGTGTNSLLAIGGPVFAATYGAGTNVIAGDGGYMLHVAPGYYAMPLGPDTKWFSVVNPNSMPILYNFCVIGRSN
jgi:hypothetical protein